MFEKLNTTDTDNKILKGVGELARILMLEEFQNHMSDILAISIDTVHGPLLTIHVDGIRLIKAIEMDFEVKRQDLDYVRYYATTDIAEVFSLERLPVTESV